jgi:protein PsiE
MYDQSPQPPAQGKLPSSPHPPAWMSHVGHSTVGWVRILLLTIIGGMTLVATAIGILDIARTGRVTVSDVLLMFIYLEIWAMISIEATTRKFPVSLIIYIAITVLTRHLVGIAGDKTTTDTGLLMDAGAILILAISALLIDLPNHRIFKSPPEAQVDRSDGAAEKRTETV